METPLQLVEVRFGGRGCYALDDRAMLITGDTPQAPNPLHDPSIITKPRRTEYRRRGKGDAKRKGSEISSGERPNKRQAFQGEPCIVVHRATNLVECWRGLQPPVPVTSPENNDIL
jgi:hypothetical protein